jgi:hypothetical protein
MKNETAWLAMALILVSAGVQAEAQKTEQKCPVVIGQVELSYNHAGGRSVPQLKVMFDNKTIKRISTVTFSLTLLGSGGESRAYPDNLEYSDGLEGRKSKVFTWDLASDSVDIHRAGQTVIVQRIMFADERKWDDDGSESCAFTVDFRAK